MPYFVIVLIVLDSVLHLDICFLYPLKFPSKAFTFYKDIYVKGIYVNLLCGLHKVDDIDLPD